MSSRRVAKVAEALRECVSTTVLFELKDPRARNVTVLHTEVSPDLRTARVFVSVMGDAKAQSLAMHGLRSARGFIQSRIADRLELRYTPILQFVLDPGVKLSVQASSIIRDALAQEAVSREAVDQEAVETAGSGLDGLGVAGSGAEQAGEIAVQDAAADAETDADSDADSDADPDNGAAAKTRF